jgi:hypothetical protein
MPGARWELEQVIRKKRDDGEHKLADQLRPIAERLSWDPHEPMPEVVFMIFALHYLDPKPPPNCRPN